MASGAAPSLVSKVDEEGFAAALKGDKLVVCDFYATWCGPCKLLAPKLEVMAEKNNTVTFLKVDVDECQELAQEHKVTAMPTLIAFKHGVEVGRVLGANEAGIKDLIKKAIEAQ